MPPARDAGTGEVQLTEVRQASKLLHPAIRNIGMRKFQTPQLPHSPQVLEGPRRPLS